MFATCPDPGEPWKEILKSLSDAASVGGFASIAVLSGTNPMPDNASVVSQIKNQSIGLPTNIFPLGLSSEIR